MKDKKQNFTMNIPLMQPPYFEECRRIDHEENDDRGSHGYKKWIGGLIGIMKDNNENPIIWRP